MVTFPGPAAPLQYSSKTCQTLSSSFSNSSRRLSERGTADLCCSAIASSSYVHDKILWGENWSSWCPVKIIKGTEKLLLRTSAGVWWEDQKSHRENHHENMHSKAHRAAFNWPDGEDLYDRRATSNRSIFIMINKWSISSREKKDLACRGFLKIPIKTNWSLWIKRDDLISQTAEQRQKKRDEEVYEQMWASEETMINTHRKRKRKETEKESRREVFPLLDSRIETLVDEQGEKNISSLT